MNTTQHAELRNLFNLMYDTLTRAQEERHTRQDLVSGEISWVWYERHQMLTAVNKARESYGLQHVPLAAVEQAEQQAVGHSDYTKKFALYCAELALDLEARP